ncbi:MAG: agmatine deiminase, partial [cyanobacterium endosymbiont of Rhopalodia inflata]
MYSLPAEWYEQDGVVLTWPHQDTDMAPFLKHVYPIY